MKSNSVILIGYSGHAYVIASIFESMGKIVTAYCDQQEKTVNPFNLTYLGSENEISTHNSLLTNEYFICIGDNKIRKKVYDFLVVHSNLTDPTNAIHSSSIIHKTVNICGKGIMISAGVVINPLVTINKGVICNTSCVIEHECEIGAFSHIGPGAVLCGNVKVGENSFVGANAVIKEGVQIGSNVIVGAGSVIIKNIPNNTKVVGNPQKFL